MSIREAAQAATDCTIIMREQGKAYPRTCPRCCLGPCAYIPLTTVQKLSMNQDAAGLLHDKAHVATPFSHPEIPDNSQPVARVTGYYGGRCVIEPLDRKSIFPVGMAMYVSGGSADAIDWEGVAADQAMTIAMMQVDAEQDKKDAARFEIKETAEGYWYVRLDAQRFAQWPVGNKLTLPRCFDSGWWTQAEVDAINKQLGFDLDDAAMQQEQKP